MRTAPSGGIVELLRNRAPAARASSINALLSMAWDLHTFFIPIYGARIGLSASRIGVILRRRSPRRRFAVRLLMPWIVAALHRIRGADRGAVRRRPSPTRCSRSSASVGALMVAVVHARARARQRSADGDVAAAQHRPGGQHGRSGGRAHVRSSTPRPSPMPLLFGAIGSTLGIGAGVLAGRRGARRRRLACAQAVGSSALQPVDELLPELGHLRRDDGLAIRLSAVALEILLMVALGRVERRRARRSR